MPSETTPSNSLARSRLRTPVVTQTASLTPPTKPTLSRPSQTQTKNLPPLIKRYIRFSPLLFITLAHMLALNFVTSTIDPTSWKDMLLPNTYLPFVLLASSTAFFAGSYLFLRTDRGFLCAGVVFFYLLLQFQAVVFTPPVVAAFVASILFLELLGWGIKKRHSKKSIK